MGVDTHVERRCPIRVESQVPEPHGGVAVILHEVRRVSGLSELVAADALGLYLIEYQWLESGRARIAPPTTLVAVAAAVMLIGGVLAGLLAMGIWKL
jgi:hypothetical protein